MKEACKLFKITSRPKAKMLKAIETARNDVRRAAEVPRQMRENHAKAQMVGKQVCEAAARGAAAPGRASATRSAQPAAAQQHRLKGAGVFETLTGNPFAR